MLSTQATARASRSPANHVVKNHRLIIFIRFHLCACCVVARGGRCWVDNDDLAEGGGREHDAVWTMAGQY